MKKKIKDFEPMISSCTKKIGLDCMVYAYLEAPKELHTPATLLRLDPGCHFYQELPKFISAKKPASYLLTLHQHQEAIWRDRVFCNILVISQRAVQLNPSPWVGHNLYIGEPGIKLMFQFYSFRARWFSIKSFPSLVPISPFEKWDDNSFPMFLSTLKGVLS